MHPTPPELISLTIFQVEVQVQGLSAQYFTLEALSLVVHINDVHALRDSPCIQEICFDFPRELVIDKEYVWLIAKGISQY